MSSPDWEGRVVGDEVHDLVAAFLTIDIQRSPDWADDLLRRLGQAQESELERWTRMGNAYELVLTPDGATIEETVGTGVDATPVAVPLDLLQRATRAWREHMSDA